MSNNISTETNITLLTMTYVEFRCEIYKLLDEYDEYITMPDTSSRIEMEDSIDNLFIKLKSK